jgi:hypothetical protein
VSPWLILCVLATGITGCLPTRKLTLLSIGSVLEDVAKASASQTDVNLVRQGLPAYLMLVDGLIESHPQERRLLLAGAEVYGSYAIAFHDPENPEATGKRYLKGRQYALRALSRHKEFADILSRPFEALEGYVSRFSRKDVPALFWFASCWAGWIGMTTDSVQAVADLPKAVLLMKRVLELDETYQFGGPHLFMGIYKSATPEALGGKPEEARAHFEKAIEIGNGQYLMAQVLYAENYAKKTFQKDLYVSLLEEVIQAPTDSVPELTLVNTVAKQRAIELLEEAEEYF